MRAHGPIARLTVKVSVVMFAPKTISFGRSGVDEVGHRFVRGLEHRVTLASRPERAAMVGVRVDEVMRHRVDRPGCGTWVPPGPSK